jgi:hypothetical protein
MPRFEHRDSQPQPQTDAEKLREIILRRAQTKKRRKARNRNPLILPNDA